MREQRFFSTRVELRESQGDEPALIGYACRYSAKGNAFGLSEDLNGFRERISPGTFREDLIAARNDVKCLRDHNSSLILGRQSNGTLKLTDYDDYGLHFNCRLNMRTTIGVDAYELIKSGLVNECSFAFQVLDGGEEWTDEMVDGVSTPVRILKRAQLFDVSVVSSPAYPDTSVSVSSISPAALMGRNLFPEGVPVEVRSHVPNLRTSPERNRNRAFVEKMLSL